MKGINLQVLFEDKVGALMTNVKKSFSSTEEERFLNEAQDMFINRLADVFELNESARRSLSKLTKYGETTPVTPVGFIPLSDNSVVFDPFSGLSTPLLRIVEEQAIDDGSNRIRIKPITHDQYLANIENPYKQPYDKLVWKVDIDDLIELIPNGTTTISSYEFRYIEEPIVIDFSSSEDLSLLDDDLYKVVDIAAGLALKSFSIGRV